MQGAAFACLPRLQELRVDAVAEQDNDEWEDVFDADLAGLPSGLQTLEVNPPEPAGSYAVRLTSMTSVEVNDPASCAHSQVSPAAGEEDAMLCRC